MSQALPSKKKRTVRRKAMVLVQLPAEIQFADPTARRWLRLFFGRSPRPRTLPRKVRRWLSNYEPKQPKCLLVKRRTERLYVKREDSYSDANILLLLELIKSKREDRLRRHLTLTKRQREVLFWIARGKSNAEIAAILRIASATVSKHLEQIYPKLGVENRTAASNFYLSANIEQN